MRSMTRFAAGLLMLLLLPAAAFRICAADEYVLGSGDVIAITVWDHPELSRNVSIAEDGKISVPPLGDLPAAGKTTTDLARDLESALHTTLRLSAQVTVSVAAFNSRAVSVAGQVDKPGRYAFETLPNLIDLLSLAGGLGPAADLSRVRILRRDAAGMQTLTVDLSKAVQTGDLRDVPPLKAGDVIIVPAAALTGPSGQIEAAAAGSSVFVLGEVARPGAYPAVAGIDLLQILSLAGGLTSHGSLGGIKVVSSGGPGGPFVVKVDLEQAMSQGRPGFPLRPGNVVLVPAQGSGIPLATWTMVQQVLSVSSNVLNLAVARNVLKQ